MIVVRNVFQIDPSHMKEAKEHMKVVRELGRKLGFPSSRILTDVTGEFYTMVFEQEYESLGDFERIVSTVFANQEWQTPYSKLRPLIRGGRREIYSVVA